MTPIPADNRPGLTAIVFRAGTYGTFRLSMLQRIAGSGALSSLKTRSDDDSAITLIDMWATVADVLTFYQERIANEGFLRTARLRDSVLRMARLLDYQLRPGVAATALIAFTLDKDALLTIPVGLRVQSVPAEGEKPQVYETLESIAADSRLNRLRILPAPVAFNPLVKGSTSATVAPGAASLAAAWALSPGSRFVLFDAAGDVEEFAVSDRRVEEDRLVIAWSGAVQGTNWDATSRAYCVGRTFRVFGCNAPPQYMEAIESSTGRFTWYTRTYSSFAYTPSANVIELDAKYEGIAAGTRLLISQPGSSNQVSVVTAVSQGPAQFLATGATTTPVRDTVTRVTLNSAPAISDRRTAVIRELTGGRLRFWGYRYPKELSGSTVYVPARRADTETVEIGRVVEKGAYSRGLTLPITGLEPGRQVLLLDSRALPVAAEVTAAAAIGLDVGITTTADDLTTAVELQLIPDSSQRLIGLRSSPLPTSISLTNPLRQIRVTAGAQPAREIALSSAPTTIDAAAQRLETALNSSLPDVPEFSAIRVVWLGNTLLVLPGVPGDVLTFEATPADSTTVSELGLSQAQAYGIDVLLSGDLSTFPSLSNPLRQFSVSFGPIGPRSVSLSGSATTLAGAATALRTALRSADPAPAFERAEVLVLDTQLLIIPGTSGAPAQEYLAISLQSEEPFSLDASASAMLGNVALASHGESVKDEVLGDGDASVPFQKFELQKQDLTYIPSAGAGGTESSLDVFVNDVLWTEVPTLFGKSPADQVYTTRIADDGKVTVQFGDGSSGARLPSGRSNVLADYRHGTGLQGRVAAGALRTPLDMPVGLRSVVNPAAATGGADPEAIEQARENAPSTVRTFGRAVSLRDFEDLVKTSGEVAKALATWVWNGGGRAVHLTVAGQAAGQFSDTDLSRIHASMTAQRDPNYPLFLDNFTPVPVVLTALVRVKPTWIASKVADAARNAILSALSFDALRFGQPLAVSEAYSVLQNVGGVVSVDIDLFHFKDQSSAFLDGRGATVDPVQRNLRIFAARPNTAPPPLVIPAELAVVEVPSEDVQIVTSGGLPD